MKYLQLGMMLSALGTLMGWLLIMHDRESTLALALAITSIILSTITMVAYTIYQIARKYK